MGRCSEAVHPVLDPDHVDVGRVQAGQVGSPAREIDRELALGAELSVQDGLRLVLDAPADAPASPPEDAPDRARPASSLARTGVLAQVLGRLMTSARA